MIVLKNRRLAKVLRHDDESMVVAVFITMNVIYANSVSDLLTSQRYV